MSQENQDFPADENTDEMTEEKSIDEQEDEIEKTVEISFCDRKGIVPKEHADFISQQGVYGTRLDNGDLELDPIEVLHLIERKRIIVRNTDGGEITARDIVNSLQSIDDSLWVRYLVFRDLRSRGYTVRQGFGGKIGFRVYARGKRPGAAAANQLVYVLRDEEPIALHDLDFVTETAAASRKKLLFALVDQNGEVNYYRVSQVTLQNKEE